MRVFNISVVLISLFSFASVACGQGTLYFNNRIPPEIDAPVTDGQTGCRLSGSNFWAQVFAAPAGSPDGFFRAVGDPLPFRSGKAAGYLDFSGGAERTVPGVAGGAMADVKVVAYWVPPGASPLGDISGFPRGQSGKARITLGGGIPPLPPANLTGLKPFSMVLLTQPREVLVLYPSKQTILVDSDATLKIDFFDYFSGHLGLDEVARYYTNFLSGQYQWQKRMSETNWITIQEGPTNTLHLRSVSKEASGEYRALVGVTCTKDFATFSSKLTVVEKPRLSVEMNNQSITLNLTGDSGVDYGIETSTNLVNWSQFQTVTNLSGTVTINAAASFQESVRFYRAVVVP